MSSIWPPAGAREPSPGLHEPQPKARWAQDPGDGAIVLSLDGIEVRMWRSMLDHDKGKPVVQIDTGEGVGPLRVNLNEAPLWDADPEHHEHGRCAECQAADRKE